MTERAPPRSTIHTERYSPWHGSFQERQWIILGSILEGVRHNLGAKWVKVLIGFALFFNLAIPLLMASFGALDLMQEAGDQGTVGNWEDAEELLGDYGLGFPLSRTVRQNETAIYNITLMNTGDRPDKVTVVLLRIDDDWNASLQPLDGSGGGGQLNFSLTAGEIAHFELHVVPPAELVSGQGRVIIEAESQSSKDVVSGFRGLSGVVQGLTTITLVGHGEDSPYHFSLTTPMPTQNVSARGEVVFSLELTNTGTQEDAYAVSVEGLPDGWKARLEGLDDMGEVEGVHLQPGESRNFTVIYQVPKYPSNLNYIAVVAISFSDHSLMGGVVNTIQATDIPDRDMTGTIFAEPGDGLLDMPILFCVFLGAVVGSKAISSDLAQKSFTIYFARPLSKLDYIAIKYGTVAATMSFVVLVPLLLSYMGLILFSDVGVSYIVGHLWVWGAIILESLLIIGVLCSLSLAFSSLTAKRSYAAFGMVVSYFITLVMSGIITGVFNDDRGTVISIHHSLTLVAAKLFDVPDVSYDYSWWYNLLFLLLLMGSSTLVVVLKIWRTELSE